VISGLVHGRVVKMQVPTRYDGEMKTTRDALVLRASCICHLLSRLDQIMGLGQKGRL
jgi:hypothetical protein